MGNSRGTLKDTSSWTSREGLREREIYRGNLINDES